MEVFRVVNTYTIKYIYVVANSFISRVYSFVGDISQRQRQLMQLQIKVTTCVRVLNEL